MDFFSFLKLKSEFANSSHFLSVMGQNIRCCLSLLPEIHA